MSMPTPSARALGLPAVFALIELAGEFPAEVKKQELKRPPLKFADAKHRYAKLEQVIALLRGLFIVDLELVTSPRSCSRLKIKIQGWKGCCPEHYFVLYRTGNS